MDTPSTRHQLPLEIGRDLRAARNASTYSIREFAQAVGISKPYLILLENGQRAPSIVVADRLIAVLNLDYERGLGADLLAHSVENVGYDRG
jgi:transcriptional regulator with XRE-family HTH domain